MKLISVFFFSLVMVPASLVAQTPAPFVPDANTVALWHFNESTGSLLLDASQYQNNATAVGTTITPGRFGNARLFNGFGDYVHVGDPANGSLDFGAGQSFTLDAWFKTTSTSNQNILRKGLAPIQGYELKMTNGRVVGTIGNRSNGSPPDTLLVISSTLPYNDGQWHLATLVRDRVQSKIFLYVDGVQAAPPLNDPIQFPLANDRPFTIGRWENSVEPAYFHGSIDEVRISTIARHPIVVVSDTIALWHYDEAAGNTVSDSSPHRNHGIATGTSIVPGVTGNARSFSGSFNYVHVPYPGTATMNFSSSQSFTVRAWFKSTQADTGEIIRRGLATVPGFALRILDGHVQGIVGNREDGFYPDTLLRITSTRSDYNDGQWHVATLVRDRALGRLYLYVDDELAAPPMIDNFPYALANDRPLTMGAWENFVRPTFYHGTLDEVGIFRGARHPVAIVSDTVALYHFDEPSGQNVNDSSPYGNHGTAFSAGIVPGYSGNARNFNGTSSYVLVPSPIALNFDTSQSFTIEAWFKTTQENVGEIVRRGLAPLPGFALRIFNGKVQGIIGNREDGQAPDTLLRITSTQLYNDGAWHNVRLVRDRGLRKLFLYVDGTLASAPLHDPVVFALASTRPLTIGRWENSTQPTYFNGLIDEVKILRGARHASTAPDIELPASTIDFGLVIVGDTLTMPVEIQNLGVFDTLRVTSVESNNVAFSPNETSVTIPPGSSRVVQLSYTPNVAQQDTGSLAVSSNDPDEPVVYLRLRGRGITLGSSPIISAVKDIPDDQGKQVRVTWYRSIHDRAPDSLQITHYSLWRKVAGTADLWDFLVSVPAVQFSQYAYVAPTLVDSTAHAGIQWSVFRLSAHTASSSVFFSDPDSGYSVDNLSPNQPTNIVAAVSQGAITLTWDSPPDPDIREYGVYRSTNSGFTPTEANRIGSPQGTVFVDQNIAGSDRWYYRIAAFDSAGNQSPFSQEKTVLLTDVEPGPFQPTVFALQQNYPNPFNPASTLQFDVPKGSHVTIKVYDMLGRHVTTLVDEYRAIGRHSVTWNASGLSSGMYIYRMNAADFSASKKMILLK